MKRRHFLTGALATSAAVVATTANYPVANKSASAAWLRHNLSAHEIELARTRYKQAASIPGRLLSASIAFDFRNVPGTSMAFAGLSDDESEAVVEYLKSI